MVSWQHFTHEYVCMGSLFQCLGETSAHTYTIQRVFVCKQGLLAVCRITHLFDIGLGELVALSVGPSHIVLCNF